VEPEVVSGFWAASGLRDLFVAFCISHAFFRHARFLEIMGLEKLLKSVMMSGSQVLMDGQHQSSA